MIKGKTTGVINHEVFYVFKFSLTAVRTLWTVSRHEERKDKQCLTEHESVLNWIKLLLRMKYHDLMNYSKLRMMMMSRRKKTTHKLPPQMPVSSRSALFHSAVPPQQRRVVQSNFPVSVIVSLLSFFLVVSALP